MSLSEFRASGARRGVAAPAPIPSSDADADASTHALSAPYALAAAARRNDLPLPMPLCQELYQAFLWKDTHYRATRERVQSAGRAYERMYSQRMWEPQLDIRVERNRTWMGGVELTDGGEDRTLLGEGGLARLTLHAYPQHLSSSSVRTLLSLPDELVYSAPTPAPAPSPIPTPASSAVPPFTHRFEGLYDKLMIVAHPDDESLFGFIDLVETQQERIMWAAEHKSRGHGPTHTSSSPPQPQPPPGWKVVVLTNSFSPQRLRELSAALASLGVWHWECWSVLDSLTEFQQVDSSVVRRIGELMYSRPWARIVTHGINGEYGHPQHRILSRVVHSLVYEPRGEDWPRDPSPSDPSTVGKEGEGQLRHFRFDRPRDAWKQHLYTQLRLEQQQRPHAPSASALSSSPSPSTRQVFPFESCLAVFATYAEHRRYEARMESLEDAARAGHDEDAGGEDRRDVDSLLREVDTDNPAFAFGDEEDEYALMPPSLTEALHARKLDLLEHVYASQWPNLLQRHALHMDFSDRSLPVSEAIQAYEMRSLARREREKAKVGYLTSEKLSDEERWAMWLKYAEGPPEPGVFSPVWDWRRYACESGQEKEG